MALVLAGDLWSISSIPNYTQPYTIQVVKVISYSMYVLVEGFVIGNGPCYYHKELYIDSDKETLVYRSD